MHRNHTMYMRAFGWLVLLLWVVGCSPKEERRVPTASVERGTFYENVSEPGEINALRSLTLSSSRKAFRHVSLKIVQIVPDGKAVEKGDTLIVFDTSGLSKRLTGQEEQLEIEEAEKEKLLSTQKAEIENLEIDLELSRLDLEISRIQSEQASYESEIVKQERDLHLKTAEMALQRAREQIESLRKVHQADLFQKELVISQVKTAIAEMKVVFPDLVVLSPTPGVAFVRFNWSTGKNWSVGDMPYGSSSLIDLPDLSVMVAEMNVSEVDVAKVQVGQRVIIRPDAFSDSVYTGSVMRVAHLAQTHESQPDNKVFPVKVMIDQQSRNLLPGLTVNCQIILSEQPNVLFIPLEAMFKDLLSDFVYVKEGNRFRRCNVVTGALNNRYAVIVEGLKEGEEVALADPFFRAKEEPSDTKAMEEGTLP